MNTARHRHLHQALDQLQAGGVLQWRADVDPATHRTQYWISEGGSDVAAFDTAAAERMAGRLIGAGGEVWVPVAAPGGEDQRQEALLRMKIRNEIPPEHRGNYLPAAEIGQSTVQYTGTRPHRSIKPAPRDGLGRDAAQRLETVMYSVGKDSGGFTSDHPVLACLRCASGCVHVETVQLLRAGDYEVTSATTVTPDRDGPSQGASLQPHLRVDNPRGSTIALELTCELGHAGFIEFSFHKGVTYVRTGSWDIPNGSDFQQDPGD